MKTVRVGKSDLTVSALCYGCMRIAGGWDRSKVDESAIARGIACIEAAVEAGYTFFDHADIYCSTACEMIYGRAMAKHPDWRGRLVVATKCGIRFGGDPTPEAPHRYDFSADHIVRSAEASLRHLNVETIDLFQLHRPDYLADPEEVARAFEILHRAGKVRWFGVSNFRPSLVQALQAALTLPIVANQVEIHLLRLDPFEDGTLDQCLERQMTPLAWSPLAQGRLGDAATAADGSPLAALHGALDAVGTALHLTRSEVALAWLLRHPSGIVPIVGSTRIDRIRGAAAAAELALDRETWYALLLAARGRDIP